MRKLLVYTNKGIYCEQADVYIDPWKKVSKAFITHGHSDHARPGSSQYICVNESKNILKFRLKTTNVTSFAFGEEIRINGVKFSFHPAGHIIGSAQIRVEYKGEVWVVSGDYKTENDELSGNFESIPCHTFITECTFGLPIFNWQPQKKIFNDINNWWAKNKDDGKISNISAYSLGKAQRLISGLNASIGKIYTQVAIEKTNEVIRNSGISLQDTIMLTPDISVKDLKGNIIIGSGPIPNSKSLDNLERAAASGWMNIKKTRNWGGADHGFVLSDHADWNGLIGAIKASKAEKVLVTHGYVEPFSKYLKEKGFDADILKTEYEGDYIEFEKVANENL